MKNRITLALTAMTTALVYGDSWPIESQNDWTANVASHSDFKIKDGRAIPTASEATLQSVVKQFPTKRSIESITVVQSPDWQNWTPVKPVGPVNMADAPVFLTKGPNDYWMFGMYGNKDQREGFTGQAVELDGFDVPLLTSPFKNQFDAPGGLKPSLGGYHAWQSRDMVNWVHHGPVTETFSRWVTTAEYVDGKTYLYYDYPNDQDPHVYIDEDLTDGMPGTNMGMAFKDPSNGSDCTFFRASDGRFHVIYEDWSPINAKDHAWDSPLAGHAVSSDGLGDFQILPPAVDLRTTPTGVIKTHPHPHWKAHPDWDTNLAEYEEHLPVQDAFGDWCMIQVGEQFYLFGDYDHAEHSAGAGNPRKEAQAKMSIARFTTNSLDEEFKLVGDFGKTGHPDPDIGFAEGQFYLVTQADQDFVSPGPWVDTVEVRVGVDTNKDGAIDEWTAWQSISVHYDLVEGFAKLVSKTPASLDLSGLPEGYGFQFEMKVTETTKNGARPILDAVMVSFSE